MLHYIQTITWLFYATHDRREFRNQTSDNMDKWKAKMGSWDDEQADVVVARKTFPSQNVRNTSVSDHFWKLKLTCRKSARRFGAKRVSKVKCSKNFKKQHVRTTFGSWDVEKVRAVVAKHISKPNCWKRHMFGHVRTISGRSDVLSRGRRMGLCTLSKVSKTWGFCSISKNGGRRGTFEEDLQRCMSRGNRSTKDMVIRDVRMSGRWFSERGCILEHQNISFGCSTSYDLASLFRGRRGALDWYEAVSSALDYPFLKEVSQNCFLFNVVKCCQLRKWRKSRRIVSFLMWSASKNEEVSQNSFVFDVVKFKN